MAQLSCTYVACKRRACCSYNNTRTDSKPRLDCLADMLHCVTPLGASTGELVHALKPAAYVRRQSLGGARARKFLAKSKSMYSQSKRA